MILIYALATIAAGLILVAAFVGACALWGHLALKKNGTPDIV